MVYLDAYTLSELMDAINASGVCIAYIDVYKSERNDKIAFGSHGALYIKPLEKKKSEGKIHLWVRKTDNNITLGRLDAPAGVKKRWFIEHTDSADLFANFITQKNKSRYVVSLSPDIFDEFVEWADLRGCALDKIAS